MEALLQSFNWCSEEPDNFFVNEYDLDRSVTERIIRNKFVDPLLSSESEEETAKVDWDKIFKTRNDKQGRFAVQALHPPPGYPKLSAITGLQHYQCLKVLCQQNPDVIPEQHFPRPTKLDLRVFEELKEAYLKEQKEYIEWAKSLWVSNHCVRTLRPKPTVEMVYEAEFKVRAQAMQSFPKNYTMAAQIPLECPTSKCDIIHQKEIVKVNASSLAQVQCPDMTKKINITRTCPVPEPCSKHPARFVLPMDTAVTQLPLTEVHNELAQFAFDNGAPYIASESALRCLVQQDRYWTLPVSVCRAFSADGEVSNVVVLGSEFSVKREAATVRTYKAYRRMLEHALTPCAFRSEATREQTKQEEERAQSAQSPHDLAEDMDVSLSDEDVDGLVIDADFFSEDVDKPTASASPTSPRNSGGEADDPEASEPAAAPQDRRLTRDSRDSHDSRTDHYIDKPTPRSPRGSGSEGEPEENPEASEPAEAAHDRRGTRQRSTDSHGSRTSQHDVSEDVAKPSTSARLLSPRSSGSEKELRICESEATQDRVTRQNSRDAEARSGHYFSADIEKPSTSARLISPKGSFDGKEVSRPSEQAASPHKTSDTPQTSRKDQAWRPDRCECTCKDTPFQQPAPRSYRRYRVRSYEDYHDIIVHMPHKLKGDTGEVIVEPIPEYQIDCGASEQAPDQRRGAALALMLRRAATVLYVRIDASTGEIVRHDAMHSSELSRRYLAVADDVANRLHSALGSLQGLVAGRYLLHHEPSHGPNALLYTSKCRPAARELALDLDLELDRAQSFEPDEANSIKKPPTLAPILLPVHKFRKILPLAFTPFTNMVAKPTKKPPATSKPPPRALQPGDEAEGGGKWRKRRRNRKKKGDQKNTQST